jgi:hypothetical protein
MTRRLICLSVVLALSGGACGETEQAEWCNLRWYVVAAVANTWNPDIEAQGWTSAIEDLWGDDVAAEVAGIEGRRGLDPEEELRAVAGVLRGANPDLWNRACHLAYGTLGSLSVEEDKWCSLHPSHVEAVADRLGITWDSVRHPDELVRACRTAYAERTPGDE